MRDIWVVVLASIGSASLLASLAALYAKLVENRAARVTQPLRTLETAAAGNEALASGLGVRFATLAMAASFVVLSNEPNRQLSAQPQRNVLGGELVVLCTAEANASAFAEI